MKRSIKPLLILALTSLLYSPLLLAENSLLDAALKSDIRSDEDKARDASRKPAETLAFFEVKPDSKVLELLPGAGWYTKILGTYLKQEGALFLAMGARPERLKLAENKLDHVTIIGEGFEFEPTEETGTFDVEAGELGEDGFDVVLTFRNVHNLSASARATVNDTMFDALKPGGVYGVIDHTKRHMEAYDEDLWRRVDPVQIIKEVQAAGFVFEDYSDLHARPDDKLIYDSTHESINRDSDRFTLKFRKPK